MRYKKIIVIKTYIAKLLYLKRIFQKGKDNRKPDLQKIFSESSINSKKAAIS